MKFISYAQNFEDVMLWRALGHIQRGFYIDVGAQSPDLDSVTRAFSEAGWSGINVEPHPVYYEQLVERRPKDINLRCALGDRPGMAVIHLVGNTGLSTLDEAIASSHRGAGHAVEQIEVPVRTLDEVWSEHVRPEQPVHFLKVDVEGFEPQVLQGNTWSRHRPWIVVVEATAPNSQAESFAAWEPRLLESAYLLAYEDGLNRYYVAHERSEFMSALRHPPNVFDRFEPAELAMARAQIERIESSLASARDRQTALEARITELEADLEKRRADVAKLVQAHEDLLARHTILQQHESRVRAALESTQEELAGRDVQLADSTERAVRAESALLKARREVETLEEKLAALHSSTSWRLTVPLRSVAGHLPAPALRTLKGAARLGWWVLTPWRLPERIRSLRQRRQ